MRNFYYDYYQPLSHVHPLFQYLNRRARILGLFLSAPFLFLREVGEVSNKSFFLLQFNYFF